MCRTACQVIGNDGSKKLAEFLCKDGQFLLPIVELITRAEMAVDELIDVTGRAAIFLSGGQLEFGFRFKSLVPRK